MIDAGHLQGLLAAYQSLGGGLGWTHGAVGAGIETSQADGVHGGTLFAPVEDYHAGAAQPAIDVAAARLACAAVNALPELLAIYEAACVVEAWAPRSPRSRHGEPELARLINLVRLLQKRTR